MSLLIEEIEFQSVMFFIKKHSYFTIWYMLPYIPTICVILLSLPHWHTQFWFIFSGKSNGKAGKSATRAILCSLFVCLLAIIALAVTLAIVVTKKIDEKNETPRATPEPGSGSQTGDGSGNCPDTGNTGSSNGMS